MRFKLAGALAAADFLKGLENENPHDGCRARGADGCEAMGAAEDEEHDAEAIPNPPVTNTRGRDHPVANPSRRLPAIDAAHDAVVAVLNVSPDGLRQCHGCTSTRPVGLERGIDVPEHTRTLQFACQAGSPQLAKTDFVEPVKSRDCRNENGERQKRDGCGFFLQEAAGEGEDVQGDFDEAAVLAVDDAAACPQASEEFFDGARSGNFSEGLRNASKGV